MGPSHCLWTGGVHFVKTEPNKYPFISILGVLIKLDTDLRIWASYRISWPWIKADLIWLFLGHLEKVFKETWVSLNTFWVHPQVVVQWWTIFHHWKHWRIRSNFLGGHIELNPQIQSFLIWGGGGEERHELLCCTSVASTSKSSPPRDPKFQVFFLVLVWWSSKKIQTKIKKSASEFNFSILIFRSLESGSATGKMKVWPEI